MLLTFFQRRETQKMGSERRKGNLIIKYANYIFFILILILLFFMIYFISKLKDFSDDQPEEPNQTVEIVAWHTHSK